MINIKTIISHNRTYVMGLSMLSVMLCHQVWIKWLPLLGFRLCGNMGVDVFFFLSGFGVVYSLKKHSIPVFYKRRLMRILPLCLFCGVCKYLLSYSSIDCLHSNRISYLTIFGFDLWFLVDLWIFYLLSPILLFCLKKYNYYCLIIAFFIAICGANLIGLGHYFTWGIVRFPAFLIGMFFSLDDKFILSNKVKICALFVVFAILYKIIYTFKILNVIELYTYLIFSLGIISLCYFLIGLIPFMKKIRLYNFATFLGVHSLELYLWHEYIYDCVWNLQIGAYCSFILAISISIFLAYLSNRIVSNVKLAKNE